jgi:hypothetical protein
MHTQGNTIRLKTKPAVRGGTHHTEVTAVVVVVVVNVLVVKMAMAMWC